MAHPAPQGRHPCEHWHPQYLADLLTLFQPEGGGGQILPTFFLLVPPNILTFHRARNVQSVLLDRKEERHGGLSYIGRSPYPKEGRCYQVFLGKPENFH